MHDRWTLRFEHAMACGILVLMSAAAPVLAVTEREVSVPSSTPGVELAGTLTLPEGDSSRNAVVLLSVAGPDDRNMSLGDRGILSSVAQVLGQRGIASLRLADRGVDGSGGDWRQTTFDERTADAHAALRFLEEEIEGASTGLVGISEGGAIAIAAAGSDRVGYVVALSPPVQRGREILEGQRDRLLAGSAFPEDTKVAIREASSRLLHAVETGDREEVRNVLGSPMGLLLLPPYRMVPEGLDERVEFVLSPWYRSQVTFDIGADLEALDVPVYAVYGELDRVLEPSASAELLRRHAARTPASRVELRPGLNHLLMPAESGSPTEYASLPEVLDRDLWNDIADWILAVAGLPEGNRAGH